jgi:hypothetical protein
LAPGQGGEPPVGFEQLWRAYGRPRRGDKPAARAAFEKVNPDATALAGMIATAEAWFAAWRAQKNPDAPRYSLEMWLQGEKYESDPPTGYKPKTKRVKKRVTATTTTAPIEVNVLGAGTDVEKGTFGIELGVRTGRFEGEVFEHDVPLGSPELANLLRVAGMSNRDDLMPLFDTILVVTRQSDGGLTFAPANDNHIDQREAEHEAC